MRTPINYFIANMALSDLLYPIFLFPRYLTKLHVHSWLISGLLGQALCKISVFLPDVSITVSVQSLVLIAVDRFGAVVFPFRSPLFHSRLCPFVILGTWVFSLAIKSPFLFSYKLVEYRGLFSCADAWNEAVGESSSKEVYYLTLEVLSFHIPTALLVILYFIIVVKLKSKKIPGEQTANAEEQRAKTNRNVFKMSVAIVLASVLCWVPYSILYLQFYFVWHRRELSCGVVLLMDITWFMTHASCAVNPFICLLFSRNYRQGLKRVLNC